MAGSQEEIDDLKTAYEETGGSLGDIMNRIPHSIHADEARFVIAISDLIAKGELSATVTWTASSKDEKAKLVRKKQADKEAKEAEGLAKELGVWDEFYGSDKAGPRKGKGKKKAKRGEAGDGEEDEEDHSALQALILKKRQNAGAFLDNLAAKYAEPEPRTKKGKQKNDASVDGGPDGESPRKRKGRDADSDPKEIDDDEFEKLQQTLFRDKGKGIDKGAETGKSAAGKNKRARRARKS